MSSNRVILTNDKKSGHCTLTITGDGEYRDKILDVVREHQDKKAEKCKLVFLYENSIEKSVASCPITLKIVLELNENPIELPPASSNFQLQVFYKLATELQTKNLITAAELLTIKNSSQGKSIFSFWCCSSSSSENNEYISLKENELGEKVIDHIPGIENQILRNWNNRPVEEKPTTACQPRTL